jgi:hypothetical protein
MNNANIKGTAYNSIKYTGLVTIAQCINSKKFVLAQIHNEGNLPLFNFLADCLAGDFDIAAIDRPTKIMLLNEVVNEKGASRSMAGTTGFISLLSKPERVYSSTEGIVRYSFMIPPEALTGATDCNAIGLYTASAGSADLDDYAARCEVNFSSINISLSSVLLVDWELHISNR